MSRARPSIGRIGRIHPTLYDFPFERVEILEGALAIGRQADPLTVEKARARLAAVREEAAA